MIPIDLKTHVKKTELKPGIQSHRVTSYRPCGILWVSRRQICFVTVLHRGVIARGLEAM